MASAAQKRHYRVVQRDKQMDAEDQTLKLLQFKEIAMVAAVIYASATLMSFLLGYLIGKNR